MPCGARPGYGGTSGGVLWPGARTGLVQALGAQTRLVQPQVRDRDDVMASRVFPSRKVEMGFEHMWYGRRHVYIGPKCHYTRQPPFLVIMTPTVPAREKLQHQ